MSHFVQFVQRHCLHDEKGNSVSDAREKFEATVRQQNKRRTDFLRVILADGYYDNSLQLTNKYFCVHMCTCTPLTNK